MSSSGSRVRRLAYTAFYRLPGRVRRRLVRVAVQKYIVGAVAIVRDTDSPAPGRLLLLRQPPGVGWGLPAGLLNRGETPLDACARELAEETGLRLDPAAFTAAVPNAVVHHRGRWVDVVFEASLPSAAARLRTDGAEVLDAQWHRLDNLPPLTGATARLLATYGIGPLAGYPEVRA